MDFKQTNFALIIQLRIVNFTLTIINVIGAKKDMK